MLGRPDVYVTECVNGIDPLHEGEGEVLQGGLWNTRFVRNACSRCSRFLGVVPCLEYMWTGWFSPVSLADGIPEQWMAFLVNLAGQ